MVNDTTLEKARYIFTNGRIIFDRINLIQRQFMASAEGERFFDLSMRQLAVVEIVLEAGELTMSELAGRLGVSPPSASAMVDRLVEKGVLDREHSTQDRRKVVVRPAQSVMEKAGVVEGRILQLFVEIVDKIGPDMSAKWCEVLDCVKSVIVDDGEALLQSADASPKSN